MWIINEIQLLTVKVSVQKKSKVGGLGGMSFNAEKTHFSNIHKYLDLVPLVPLSCFISNDHFCLFSDVEEHYCIP